MAIKGLDSVFKMFDRKDDQIRDELKAIVNEQGNDLKEEVKINANAISYEDLSGNLVYLPNKIHSMETRGGMGHEVTVDADNMAAYIEFGTGHYAGELLSGYPTEWKHIAMEFYVNGKGTTNASPYLYPAFVKRRAEFVKKLKEGLIRVCEK